MKPNPANTSTTRLFSAADALLAAMQQGGTVPMSLAAPTSSQLAVMQAFTPGELMNAMDMLIRMGFVTRHE